jgi:hypothetical protein
LRPHLIHLRTTDFLKQREQLIVLLLSKVELPVAEQFCGCDTFGVGGCDAAVVRWLRRTFARFLITPARMV